MLERVEGLLAAPLFGKARGLVHDVAKTENEPGAGRLQMVERSLHLAAHAERLLVDQEDVGRKDFRRLLDDLGPDLGQILDGQAGIGRGVAIGAELGDARHADEVDLGREGE